jgi:hypothetical protein
MNRANPISEPLPEVAAAAARLTHLGFLLVSAFPPGAADSELLVSMRAAPTLQHFDTEVIRYWRTEQDRRGHPVELDRRSPMPVRARFSWGKVELVDRLGVENEFVTLGGELWADHADPGEIVAVLRSRAPILRIGGHSQAADLVAPELAAFFGRLMVPIDFDPGVEEAIAAADPLTRYATFLAFESDRYRGHLLLRQEHPEQARIVVEEAQRLRTARPDAWQRGVALLERLALRR